jgi:hypothetical protein
MPAWQPYSKILGMKSTMLPCVCAEKQGTMVVGLGNPKALKKPLSTSCKVCASSLVSSSSSYSTAN